MTDGYTLVEASEPRHFAMAAQLFREYGAQLGIDLDFQGFPAELNRLPAMYGPPAGCLILAFDGVTAVACGALREHAAGICEMKRLYVRNQHRNTGIGRRVVQHLVWRGRGLGYRSMRLDTLANMTAARRLYASLGFREIPAYYPNPLPDAVYLELTLTADGDSPPV